MNGLLEKQVTIFDFKADKSMVIKAPPPTNEGGSKSPTTQTVASEESSIRTAADPFSLEYYGVYIFNLNSTLIMTSRAVSTCNNTRL